MLNSPLAASHSTPITIDPEFRALIPPLSAEEHRDHNGNSSTTLMRLGNARREIEFAVRIDDVKNIRDKAEALRLYAKQAGESLEVQNQVAEIKIRAERRAGELLKEMERKGERASKGDNLKAGPKSHRVTSGAKLDDLGINKKQSSRWQAMAAIPEDTFDGYVQEVKEANEELTSASALRLAKSLANGNPHVANNSGDNEWYTPKEYIAAAHTVMGGIDLDPASSKGANQVVGAKQFYSEADNGLLKPWAGRIWMNPPYASKLIAGFASKLVESVSTGAVTQAVVLVNNATETDWFSRIISVAAAVVFPSSRVKFWSPDGRIAAPLQGQAVLYIGEKKAAFRKEFSSFGWYATVGGCGDD